MTIPTWVRRVGLLLPVIAVAYAAHEVTKIEPESLIAGLRALSPARWGVAIAATAASFAALAGYEVLAVRAAGLTLPTRTVVGTGLVGWSIGQALGPAWLSGGAVRLRMYGRAGVAPADVGRVVAANLVTFWASLVALLGAALVIDPVGDGVVGRVVGAGLLGATAAAVVAARRWPDRIRRFVDPATLPLQLAVGVADNVAAVVVLAACLPASSVSFPELVVCFAAANVAGMLSGVPGGVGTLEAGLLALLTPALPAADVLAGVVAWRAVYTVLPLLLGLAGFATAEVRARPSVGDALRRAVLAGAPAVSALAAFAAGTGLLVSTFAPGAPASAAWLGAPLPDEVLAASHAATAAVGVGLWFVARGLWARTREAWGALTALLVAGAVASLLRGVDADGLVALGLALAAWPLRRAFFRRAALLREHWSPLGWAAVSTSGLGLAVALGSCWIHVDAPWELPWLGVIGGSLAAAVLGSVLRPARAAVVAPTESDVADAIRIARGANVTVGWLAATGDKSLLFDAERRAFLMYGVHRDRWICFGGPIGDPAARGPLLADFRARARRAGARIALYEIPAELVPACADLGLRTYKFGEEARVEVGAFTLEGGANKGRRALVNKLVREGVVFEVLPEDAVVDALPELRAVSDAWLREKGAREKGFSLGRFDEAWLRRAPVAVVRAEGRIVAFANLLAAGSELSVDLMRFAPEAPKGTMDFLFLQLLAHAKAEGHRGFALGMAPLAGIPDAHSAWSAAAGLAWSHGGRWYNFQGLRAFKEKFHPEWSPVYLAVEGRFGLPVTLGGLLALVGGR